MTLKWKLFRIKTISFPCFLHSASNMTYFSPKAGALGRRVFRLPQVLAVFPFLLRHDGLFLDPVLLVYVMIMKLALGVNLLLIEEPAIYLTSVVAFFAVIFHSIIIFFKKDTFNKFLKLLSDLEFSFLQSGKKSVIVTNYVYDYLLLALNVLAILLDSFLQQDVSVVTLSKIWMSLSILGVVHPFFHFVLVMQRGFLNLNEMIQDPSNHKASWFRHLTELHQRCTRACLTLNDCFTQQVLWITGALFLFMTVTSYKVFSAIEADSGFLVVVIKVFHLLYFISVAFIVCMVCQQTSAEAKRFDFLLHRLMIVDVTGEFACDDKLSLHIAMKQELCFSANNVFALDYTLIHSMISAATTYLVIQIQMNG